MADALLSRLSFIGPVTSLSFAGQVLDISTDAIEIIFQAPEAIAISRLWYRFSTITGTSPVFQISLQGVNQTVQPAVPDGTIKSSGNAKATFTPSAGNLNTGQWINLTSSYTCTRGEMLAIVIAFSSGTINASNSVFSAGRSEPAAITAPTTSATTPACAAPLPRYLATVSDHRPKLTATPWPR